MTENLYSPKTVFAQADEAPPRVLVAPQRYVQGSGVIRHIGRYINALMKVKRVAILASKRGLATEGAKIVASLSAAGIESVNAQFNGECSRPEIASQLAALDSENLDCLIAVGGGKLVDAGKCIAHRLAVPVVIVPTLASNDAPCTALSVLYTPDGVKDGVEYFPQNPALVVMDTEVVAGAGERYLVAGMGDAMATWYEAKVCLHNPDARTSLGARPTLAAAAIAETCANTLYQYGEAAAQAVRENRVTEALEKVVEANTLLSGVGFESGGLAVAHALAVAFTEIKTVHDNYLHGEMVAVGTLVQLVLEQSNEAEQVATFFARIGLPVHLGQLALSPDNPDQLATIIDATLTNGIAHHMPQPVTRESLRQAILDAHQLGVSVVANNGDEAYQRQH